MRNGTGLRVLYITEGWTPHDARFLRAMVHLGHQPAYLPWSARGRGEAELPAGVLRVGELPPLGPGTWRAWVQWLRQVYRQGRFDLVHGGPLPWGVLPAVLAGWRPVVAMSWGSDVLWHGRRKPWLRWLMRVVLSRSTLVLADCRAVAEQVHRWGVPWSRVVVFPWGTDLGVFAPGPSRLRSRLGLGEAGFVWVHVRTWSRFYGLPTVVEGFYRAWRRWPGMRLLLVGGGPLARWVEKRVQGWGLDGPVLRVAKVPEHELPHYLRAADAYVSVSRSDGSSVSLMQALAVGLPVVVSDIPGNREWVTPGVEGFLVPVDDAEALARMMVHMARLPRPALHRMRQAARRRAQIQANWQAHIRQLDRAYRTAVEWETRFHYG